MKRATIILVCLMAVGLAWAQSPSVIQNTRTAPTVHPRKSSAASSKATPVKAAAQPKSAVIAVKSAAVQPKSGAVAVKSAAVQPKSGVVAVKPAAVQPKSGAAAVKPAAVQPKSGVVAVKPAAAQPKSAAVPKKATPPLAVKSVTSTKSTPTQKESAPASNSGASGSGSAQEAAKDDKNAPDKKWSMTGKRDPFISPVVNHAGGSGCSTGKKCLEIGNINLRGVVRADSGFIAVVTNSLNKAYFLRENDPVFDGYVVKITGDSITFKETVQDRLGKSLTREVVKKIATPAV